MKRRKFAQDHGAPIQTAQTDNRIQLLPETTRNFVRAAQTIGSTQRAIEELVRNSIVHGRANEVNVTFGSVKKQDGCITSFLQVRDDGFGIDEESTREFIGTLHCSSITEGATSNQNLIGNANKIGSYRGEALKALAALSIEFRVQTTCAVFAAEQPKLRGCLISAPSKSRRILPLCNVPLNQSTQVEATICSEKIVRDGEVVAFRSIKSKIPSSNSTGTSIQLYGLFHKHQVRLRHYQLSSSSSSHGVNQLHIGQLRSSIQILALAFPHVTIRLFHTKSNVPDTMWMRPTAPSNGGLLNTSAIDINGLPSREIYRKAIKQRFASFSGNDEVKTTDMLDISYLEGRQQRTGLRHPTSLSISKSKDVATSSSFASNFGRWEVCGVLFQKPKDTEVESAPLTNRMRQNEIIFVNSRLLKHHTALADTIQKICTFHAPSMDWSFLLHITCPPNDFDLVIDETRSYSSVRQRDRLEALIRDAVSSTLNEYGMSKERRPRTIPASTTKCPQMHALTLKDTQKLPATGNKDLGPNPGNLLYRTSRAVSGKILNRQRQDDNEEDDSSEASARSSFADTFLQPTQNTDQGTDMFEDAFMSKTKYLAHSISSQTNTLHPFSETKEPHPTEQNINLKAESDTSTGMTWTRSRLKSLDRNISSLVNRHGSDKTAIKISKDMLSRAKFIAQLDAKYIVVNMDGILCVVDQHAADERVGLERLEDALEASLALNGDSDARKENTFDLSKLKNINTNNLIRKVATKDLKLIVLTTLQSSTVSTNEDLLKKWRFGFDHDPVRRELKLTTTPCIGDKVATKKDFIQFVQALSNGMPSSSKPAFVKRILASYACRYAVMFGDILDDDRCRHLLSSLPKCDLSFICAHGRPSVVPLLDLNGCTNDAAIQKSSGQSSCVEPESEHVPLRFQQRKKNQFVICGGLGASVRENTLLLYKIKR